MSSVAGPSSATGPSTSAREVARNAGAGCVSEVQSNIHDTTETLKMCVPRPNLACACVT